MMKSFIVFAIILAIVAAAPPGQNAEEEYEIVPIVKNEVSKGEDGSYKLSYVTGDGSEREEESTVIDAGTDQATFEVKGSYKYINEHGDEVEVFYTAGKNGFVPYGSIVNPEITAVAEAAKALPHFGDDDDDDHEDDNKHRKA